MDGAFMSVPCQTRGGLFDIDYEADFATRDEALRSAEIRATIHNVLINEY